MATIDSIMSNSGRNEAVTAKIRLKENDRNGEFRPFVVNHLSNRILKKVIDGFENSKEISLGYSTIDKTKGVTEPTMKKKSLYLTGGALRDHLKNKTFSTYDCSTDASPDEMRLILKSKYCNFTEVKPDTHDLEILNQYKKLPNKENKKEVFYASRWDANNREMEFTVEVDGQIIHIGSFNINNKNRMLTPKFRKLVTTIEQDSTTRDLTIDSLYLKLKNGEGENSELYDPQGGAYDLNNGIINTVRKPEKAFDYDPYLPYRIANLASRFSHNKKIPQPLNEIIKEIKSSDDVKRHNLKRFYISSIENFDVPTDIYINNLIYSNLTEKIFPGLKISKPVKDLTNSKLIATAYILKENQTAKVQDVLSSMGWSKIDIENICRLVNLAKFCESKFNPDLIYDLFAKPLTMSNNIIKQFLVVLGESKLYEVLFKYDFSDVMKKYVEDEDGKKRINPIYVRILERIPRTDELEEVRKKAFFNLVRKLVSA